MAAMPKLTVLIPCKDEAGHIRDCIESVRPVADEILIADSGSTDATLEIVRSMGGCRVIQREYVNSADFKNWAIPQCQHEWVFIIDADERVTPELRDEIKGRAAAGFEHAGYRIPRLAFYLGHWIRGTDWWPDPQLRLFDRRRGRWQGSLIHESVRVDGSVGRLRERMEHFSYDDISDHLATIDRYTTLWAEQAAQEGHRSGPLDPAAAALWAFLRNYVVRRGVVLGEAGLTVSILNSYYTYVKLAKLRERRNGGAPPRT